MSTLTLDVPAPLAARLDALPTDKVHAVYAAALDAIEEEIAALEAGQWRPTPVSPSDLSQGEATLIRERLASLSDGRAAAIPGASFLAEMRERAKGAVASK